MRSSSPRPIAFVLVSTKRFLDDLGYKVASAGINKLAIHDSDPASRKIESLVPRTGSAR